MARTAGTAWETERRRRDCSLKDADTGGIAMQPFMPPLTYSETWSFRRAGPGRPEHGAGCHWRITKACSMPLCRILCRGGAWIRSFHNKMSHTSRIVMKKALPTGSAFRLAGLCRYPGAGTSHERMRRSDVSVGATGGQAPDRFPGWGGDKVSLPSLPFFLFLGPFTELLPAMLFYIRMMEGRPQS